jgi:hypothetical protein
LLIAELVEQQLAAQQLAQEFVLALMERFAQQALRFAQRELGFVKRAINFAQQQSAQQP